MAPEKRMNRWYFGGISATSAAVCTHPLDLLKTIVQTPDPAAAKKVIQGRACHSTTFYAYSAVGYNPSTKSFVKLPTPALAAASTPEVKLRLGLVSRTATIVRTHGIRGLYNGLSASCLRQMFHSTTRYGLYEVIKQKDVFRKGDKVPLLERILIATFSGTCGGIVGTPPDVVKIRMQNDVKLPGKVYVTVG